MKALSKRGFKVIREGSKHTIVGNDGGQREPVPRHGDVNRNTMRRIAKNLGIDWHDIHTAHMRTYHVVVEPAEDGWMAAHALEDDSVHTQGMNLDEVTANIREVAELLYGDNEVQVELIIPSTLPLASA